MKIAKQFLVNAILRSQIHLTIAAIDESHTHAVYSMDSDIFATFPNAAVSANTSKCMRRDVAEYLPFIIISCKHYNFHLHILIKYQLNVTEPSSAVHSIYASPYHVMSNCAPTLHGAAEPVGNK